MNRAQYAFDYFVKQGWTPIQAAAIVGNLQQESGMGLDPNAIRKHDAGRGNHSIGLGQWNRDRLSALYSFAGVTPGSPVPFEKQLEFVQHELGGAEAGVAAKLKQANDLRSATAAFIGYERPQGWSAQNPMAGHGFNNRLNNAMALASGNPNTGSDDPSIQPQTAGGFQFPHAPNLDPLPGLVNIVSAAGDPPNATPDNSGGGILGRIFGSLGKQPDPYWMKGKGWDDEAKKAYLMQNLGDKGWPSLRSFLG